ncbi:MAG: hypothetical protein QW591_02015 [Candidatus Micrarchaeaceae archaeon]
MNSRNKLLIAIFLVAVVVAVIGGLIAYLKIAVHITPPPPPAAVGRLIGQFSLNTTGIFTFDNAQDLVAYALLNYNVGNSSSTSISFNIYQGNPLPKIYLLDVSQYCLNCNNLPQLYSNLTLDLSAYGLLENGSSISMVSISNLTSTQPGSIIIISSGLMPAPLLSGATMPLQYLLSKGDTIIYVGENFSREMGPNGIIFQTPQQTSSALSSIHISTAAPQPSQSSNPLSLYFINPTFSFSYGSVYGPLAYVGSLNGTLIAFSNFPSSIWRNSSAEATDISKAINSRFWMAIIAAGSYNSTINGVGRIGIVTTSKPIPASSAASIGSAYPLLSIATSNATTTIYKNIEFSIHFSPNGTIGLPSVVGETQVVPIIITMNTTSSLPTLVTPHIDIYTLNMDYVGTIPIGFFNTTSSISIIKYQRFALPSGIYLLFLRNFYNKYYSSALFQLANITISPIALNFANGTFEFEVTSNGQPVSNLTYTISLNGAYSENGTVEDGIIYYALPKGTVVSYGNQNFVMKMLSTSYTYSASYTKKIFHIPAIYIEFAVVAVVVILLNVVLKAPTRDEYYIDVPTFPPVKRVSVSVGKQDFLNVFNKVNYYYHWRYMPLTAEEVKNGIEANLRSGNMPIAVTLQNVLKILNVLSASGDIVSMGNYYAPKSMVEESGHDIEYLAIFRKLRDYFVANAIIFTDLDASQNADMLITKTGVHANIIIYSSISGMRKFELSKKVKTFIIFFNEDVQASFTDKLYLSYGDDAELMRLGIAYGYIKLLNTDSLDQLIF